MFLTNSFTCFWIKNTRKTPRQNSQISLCHINKHFLISWTHRGTFQVSQLHAVTFFLCCHTDTYVLHSDCGASASRRPKKFHFVFLVLCCPFDFFFLEFCSCWISGVLLGWNLLTWLPIPKENNNLFPCYIGFFLTASSAQPPKAGPPHRPTVFWSTFIFHIFYKDKRLLLSRSISEE